MTSILWSWNYLQAVNIILVIKDHIDHLLWVSSCSELFPFKYSYILIARVISWTSGPFTISKMVFQVTGAPSFWPFISNHLWITYSSLVWSESLRWAKPWRSLKLTPRPWPMLRHWLLIKASWVKTSRLIGFSSVSTKDKELSYKLDYDMAPDY